MAEAVERAVTHDAVVVLPGIMGSELVEAESGRVLWGIADPRWYVSAWTSGKSLVALKVTDDERAGRSNRIFAKRLLRVSSAFAPVLRGVEPYSDLITGLRSVVAHPDAILEFPYDWRLPVAVIAERLADAAYDHLRQWRAHPDGSKSARLVLVAHSMGGLVARYFTGVLGGRTEVRRTVTLGTPFYGSVKAAYILGSGRGAPVPLPHARLRDLAATLPGIYDLLPSYRCVDEETEARRLTPADLAVIGADRELAEDSFASRDRMFTTDGGGLSALVGVEQPTMQSLVLADGVVTEKYYICEDKPPGGLSRVNRGGDSTVYRESATADGVEPMHLPQAHAALASTEEAIAHVRAVLTDRRLGPPLGATAIGLEVQDVVTIGKEFEVAVLTLDDPAAATCQVVDTHTSAPVAWPQFARRDGTIVARVTLQRPGVYRVGVKGGGFSAVTQMVMAAAPADLDQER
jgi:pimeloyl-ACP methyl ester carboxylesterase